MVHIINKIFKFIAKFKLWVFLVLIFICFIYFVSNKDQYPIMKSISKGFTIAFYMSIVTYALSVLLGFIFDFKKTFKLITKLNLWVFLMLIVFIYFIYLIIFDKNYTIIFKSISKGLATTFYISVVSYIFSILLGLIFALIRISNIKIISQLVIFYVELIRSLPTIVVLYYVTYAGTPFIINLINSIFQSHINIKDIPFSFRASSVLILCYSAFLSELFRAGIESIDKKQTEASRALGLSWTQSIIYIILPQVLKNILPILVNEFISIIKDSSLVSVLGVKDITYMGKVYSASTFKFFESYNIVAFLYLIIIMILNYFVKYLEKRLKKD